MGKFDVVPGFEEDAGRRLRDYDKPKDFYSQRRIRTGKTIKDRNSGAHANRMKNRDARNEWCNNRNAKNNTHPSGNK